MNNRRAEILRKKREELQCELIDVERKHGGLFKGFGILSIESIEISNEIKKLTALIDESEKVSINEMKVVGVDSDSCEKILILLGGVLSCIKESKNKRITQDYLSTAFSETSAANKLRMKKRTVDDIFAKALGEFVEKTKS